MQAAFFDTKPYDRPGFDKYGKEKGIEYHYFESKLREDTVELARGSDAVVAFVHDELNAKVIDKLCEMGIRVLALRCAGFNHVDRAAANGRIHVLRVPAYSPYAVAEHAMALTLTLIRKTHKAYIRTRDFNFSLNRLVGFDLHGKTAGIIGTGKIGRAFAEICRGFGMDVIAYDAFPDEKSGIHYVTLDKLFRQSDLVSLHCPLTKDTASLINRQNIDRMKRGAILINTSRGGLVDTEALLEGLKEKKLGGAALDVYEEESDLFYEDFSDKIVQDDLLARLLSMPNVILTSHQGFLTQEALDGIAKVTTENIESFFRDGSCPNEIRYQD